MKEIEKHLGNIHTKRDESLLDCTEAESEALEEHFHKFCRYFASTRLTFKPGPCMKQNLKILA